MVRIEGGSDSKEMMDACLAAGLFATAAAAVTASIFSSAHADVAGHFWGGGLKVRMLVCCGVSEGGEGGRGTYWLGCLDVAGFNGHLFRDLGWLFVDGRHFES